MDYCTIAGYAEAEFTERKSRFISYITPVSSEEEAVAFIDKIRAMHRKATHNVYAYTVRNGNLTRYSDDGEPQGTAGLPVFEVLRKEGLSDVCCVVTRYFGGILLGGGGLVRAYSGGAKLAVDAAVRMVMCPAVEVSFSTDYNFYGKITYILPEFNVKDICTDFTDSINMKFYIREELFEAIEKKISDISNGSIQLCKSDTLYYDFS